MRFLLHSPIGTEEDFNVIFQKLADSVGVFGGSNIVLSSGTQEVTFLRKWLCSKGRSSGSNQYQINLNGMTLVDAQILADILQKVVLMGAGIFTAWWAYSTFGYKEKTAELTAVAKKIIEIHSFIESSALQNIVFQLTGSDDSKYQDWRRQIESRYVSLLGELNELQDLSFSIPAPFRVLRMIEYHTDMFAYRSLDQWNSQDVKNELINLRVKILHDIAEEANRHRFLFRRMNVLFQNLIYRVKNLFSH